MKFCWCTLSVNNLEESLAFYNEVVGLRTARRFSPAPDTEIVFLDGGGAEVELICTEGKPPASVSDGCSLGFEVSSLRDTQARLAAHGIAAETDIIQPNEHVRFLFVRDPDGYRIQFVEHI